MRGLVAVVVAAAVVGGGVAYALRTVHHTSRPTAGPTSGASTGPGAASSLEAGEPSAGPSPVVMPLPVGASSRPGSQVLLPNPAANQPAAGQPGAGGPGGGGQAGDGGGSPARPDLPAAPTGLTLTAISPTTIRLHWTDNATNELGYNVWYQDGGYVAVPPNDTQYDWTGLPADTQACFRVSAYNDAGSTVPWPLPSSGWTCVRTFPLDSHPLAPSNFRVDAGGNAVQLDWTNNSSFASIRIEQVSPSYVSWSLSPGTIEIGEPIPVTYETVVTYCYRIQAYRADNGESSPWTGPVCDDSQPYPNGPTLVSATAINGTTVHLVWLDNSAVETGYRIVRSGGGQVADVVVLSPNTTSYDMTGMNPATNYCFQLMSFNSASHSSVSVCVTTESASTANV